MEACLNEIVLEHISPVRVLEIGMHDGNTARGIEKFFVDRGIAMEYMGIDPDDGSTRPRHVPKDGKVIVGDSAEVFEGIPSGFDLVWVDGCHCFNHVVLDTLHYARKVRPGGFICFHDINPAGQNEIEHQYHGPQTPAFGLAVNSALEAIRFPWAPWTLFGEKYPSDRSNCGTRAYRKGEPS